jgi:hypothetical protein
VDRKPVAWTEPTFGAGSATVVRGDRLYRLAWPLDDKDKRRMLAPGKYIVRTTRIERKKGESTWFFSASSPKGRPLTVERTGRTKLALSDRLMLKGHAKPKGKGLQLGFGLRCTDGRGVSVYRDGKRIAVRYRVLDKNGNTLAKGAMNYG